MGSTYDNLSADKPHQQIDPTEMFSRKGGPILKRALHALLKTSTMGLAALAAGCSTVSSVVEEYSYPRDTAVNIDKYHYLINTQKCADATRISPDGVIDCRAADGTKSASISPVGDLQMSLFKYNKFAWGSEEHQALLYDFHYLGGKERMAQNLVGSVAFIYSVNNTMKSTKYGSIATGIGPNYGSAPELKQLSVWDAREYSLANWSLQNSNLYNFGNGTLVNKNGIVGTQIGNITYYKNGVNEYSSGSHSYFSNGLRSMQITDSITAFSNGKSCTDIGPIKKCQ
ncbi:hypothetical protein [Pseudomonas fluorescens]|uniref:hypothetical protein n=1 Tax=Pseudomonas fluorescens TaxID=294 RepID=UPI00177EC307|nr:hypothetical protein [Pseudomonas fluorescens]